MSRHRSSIAAEEPNLVEVYVNYVSINALQVAMTLEEIKQETKHDTEMQAVNKGAEIDIVDCSRSPELQEGQRRTICVQWAGVEKKKKKKKKKNYDAI